MSSNPPSRAPSRVPSNAAEGTMSSKPPSRAPSNAAKGAATSSKPPSRTPSNAAESGIPSTLGRVPSIPGSSMSRTTSLSRSGGRHLGRTTSGRTMSQGSSSPRSDDEDAGLAGHGVAGRGGGGGRVARQLLYSELLSRPGGPWAWMEVGNTREKALPKAFHLNMFEYLDVNDVSLLERSSRLWRDLLQTPDGVGIWQRVVHERVGSVLIESYKMAMGLRSGQSYEQERLDLQSRNWRRIMRMHRANLMLPFYKKGFHVTMLAHHVGPVLCMSTGGPYLFTGGSDGKLLMYRVPLFLTFTQERVREFKKPPAPSRMFGQPKKKNGLNIAHDCPILCIAAEKEFVMSAGVDGVIKLWNMESAPGSACARKYIGHAGGVWCMSIGSMQHDGEKIQILISGSADKTIGIWNIYGPKGARPLMLLQGHFGGVTAVAFIAAHGQVVSGSEDTTMRLWNLATGHCDTVLEGHTQAITALVPWCAKVGGKTYDVVFSCSRAGDIRMWDRDAAVEVMKVVAHTGPVASLAASLVPECCMVSCGIDGVLHLWKTDDLVCLRSVRPPMPSELTRAQEALKQLMDQEEKARWAATQVELEGQLAQLDEDGSPHSPISTASVSPADSPTDERRKAAYKERGGLESLQEDDGFDIMLPVRDGDDAEASPTTKDGGTGRRTSLEGDGDGDAAGGQQGDCAEEKEEEEEDVDDSSESSDDENPAIRDMEGAGGFTKCILWGNVMMASSWDGLIRVWVYTEH